MNVARISAWLPDIAANILCVVLVVLTILATRDHSAPVQRAVFTPVLGGDAAVSALYDRATGTGPYVDLLSDGPIPSNPTPDAAVFVFDQRHYGALPLGLGPEISVPDALRNGDRTYWSDAFLTLGGAENRAEFQQDLIALLASESASNNNPTRRPKRLFRAALKWTNVTLCLICLLGIAAVTRRGYRTNRRFSPASPARSGKSES